MADTRTVVVTFPCGRCGEPAQWSFPLSMLIDERLGAPYGFGAQCTRCGHRVVTTVEVKDEVRAAQSDG